LPLAVGERRARKRAEHARAAALAARARGGQPHGHTKFFYSKNFFYRKSFVPLENKGIDAARSAVSIRGVNSRIAIARARGRGTPRTNSRALSVERQVPRRLPRRF